MKLPRAIFISSQRRYNSEIIIAIWTVYYLRRLEYYKDGFDLLVIISET